jgi:hypothetical protein
MNCFNYPVFVIPGTRLICDAVPRLLLYGIEGDRLYERYTESLKAYPEYYQYVDENGNPIGIPHKKY